MATTRIRLQNNESRTLEAGTYRVSGGTGSESVILGSGATATFDNKVETVTLAGAIGSYTFERKGKSVVVKQGGAVVATIAAQTDADGTQVSFADVTASLVLNGRNLELGGNALSKTPSSLSADDIGAGGSAPAKGGPSLDLSDENRPVRISDVSTSSFGSSNSLRLHVIVVLC